MINTVIIYGDKKDTQIKDALLKLLSEKHQINYISDTSICSFGGEKSINIIETSILSQIKIKNAVLILKNNAKISGIRFVDKSINVVINADNTKNLQRLTKIIKNVYTCGFSSKDYVTFSSREHSSANISLQRSIKLLNGSICEPMEIPCSITNEMSDYSLLSLTLTLILLGIINENKLIL